MENNYGSFVRLLMFNHNKNLLTKKTELKDHFKIQNSDISNLINYSKENLKVLGLELVGIEKNCIIDPLKSEKYSIRRISNNISFLCDDIQNKMVIVFTFIILEGKEISFGRLINLCSKIDLFSGDNIEEYLMFLKRENYLYFYKEENEFIVELGYKYYIEYGEVDFLDLLDQQV